MLGAILIGALLCLLPIVYGNIIVYTQDTPHSIIEEFRDMPASFGNDLPPEGLRGFLVKGEPENGCSALARPPVIDNFTGKWIVLVARYNCSFEVKVRNAQAAGYDCAIVHNVDSSELETMSAKDPDGIVIPSVFVSDQAGQILSQEYIFTKGYYIMVNGDLPFNINTHLLLPFAIVVVLCLLVILIFMIVKCIKDRRQARRHRLPNRSLKKIPTCKFSKGDPYDTCAICLDDYQEGERLRVLPCAHAYHAACIDPWLTQNKRVCPVCKRRVFVAGERRRVDSDSGTDSDTEPLLADTHATQGGTFEEQQENPFVRAARFVRGLRRDAPATTQDPSAVEEVDQTNNTNEEIVDGGDRQPLLPAVATVSSERRRRRRARSAAARPTRAPATAATPAPEPAPVPHAASPTTALLRTDAHSINNEAAGEIGVAALPATPLATSAPHQVHL